MKLGATDKDQRKIVTSVARELLGLSEKADQAAIGAVVIND
jgi:hypothetical protein